MPKTTAPLLSFGASGQIAKTQVYSTWKGIPYVRRYVTPSNPRTVKQTANRSIWQMINQAWLYAPTSITAAFNSFATGKPLTGRNKFFSDNQRRLATQPPATDLSGFVMSPGSLGGLPPSGITITPASNSLDIAVTLPEVPTGWTLEASIAAALPNVLPTEPFGGNWYAATETVAPEDVTINGLDASTDYAVGVFLQWTRPDGKTAYSVSIADTATTTA